MKGQALLRVSVLGNLAVLRHGTKMQLPRSKKTRALLAYLAVTARPHSRDRLCAMFWAVPDDPRAALRWSLSRLRPLIDEPDCRRIIADRENVGLNLDRITVDILSLRSEVRNGTDAMSTDALRQAIEALEGDFLEGLDLPDCQEFQSWCIGEREETRRLRVRLLTALVTRLEDVPDEALRYARMLSLLEPANEAAQATLVRLLRAAGRWREAEEQFHSAQRRLEEFNVVCTGALRQAAQLPVQANPRKRADDRGAPLTSTERLPARPASHEVQFCRTSDDVRICYACVGDGPPLVWTDHWLSHLAFNWESPIWRHWTEEFAKDHAFVHFDQRGHGLSDWEIPEFSVDAFVRDLEAVVDALGLDRFALIGGSRAGSTAIAYAARHPERVSHLVVYGAFAQGWRAWGNAAEIERRETTITLTRRGWTQGSPAVRQILPSLLLPDANPEEIGWFSDLRQISVSAENAARLQQSSGDLSVLDLLPGIASPTLVLHCRDDEAVPFGQSRLIASRIPGARLVPLESRNHILLPRDPAWAAFVREVRQFLGESAPTIPGAERTGAAVEVGARTRADDSAPTVTATRRQPAHSALHEVQFCRTADDVRIAYACVGDGPPLVWAGHWLSHLAFNWESPIWRHWTEEFARDHTFVHYDQRGHGLSDWKNPDFSVDAFVRDLEAVVDTLGLDRFALIGSSRASPTAIAYAARHPERVSRLVLHGAFAQGWREWGNAAEIERREATITLTRQGWGQDNPAFRQILTSLLLPDATLEETGWLNELQRISISAENAARVQRSSGDLHVLDLLPGIEAPTLVLHCRNDEALPFEQGRLVASRIPRARFVTLEGRNHFLLPRDPAWAAFVSEVRRFLREGLLAISGAE